MRRSFSIGEEVCHRLRNKPDVAIIAPMASNPRAVSCEPSPAPVRGIPAGDDPEAGATFEIGAAGSVKANAFDRSFAAASRVPSGARPQRVSISLRHQHRRQQDALPLPIRTPACRSSARMQPKSDKSDFGREKGHAVLNAETVLS